MEYEYDSWKICASRMKRKQFFSPAHFASPFPTVNYQLSTVNWIHTFSAKEKDSETGLSYFGSRYYSSDLSIWLSVDPMSDKYPSLSPYVYCANNPIKLVDPDGEEMTKFEDANGNLIKQIDDGSNAVFQQVGAGRGLHYEFSGFDESQGGVNEVNLGTAIQEQQQMNMDNTELQQSADGTTYCNYATQNVMKTVSSVPDYGDALVTGTANTMCDKMENSANFVSVSKSQAVKYGKKGLAIVAYKNPDGHGHVATFSAGNNGGEVANIGPTNLTGFKSVNQVISSKRSKKYYIFVPGKVADPVNIK